MHCPPGLHAALTWSRSLVTNLRDEARQCVKLWKQGLLPRSAASGHRKWGVKEGTTPPGPQRRRDGLASVGFTKQELKTPVSQKIL